MKVVPIDAPEFDLAVTLDSGQVFNWEAAGAGYVGTVGDRAVYAEQRDQQLFVTGLSREEAIRYFALDHPLAEICAGFPNDAAMCAARVLRSIHRQSLTATHTVMSPRLAATRIRLMAAMTPATSANAYANLKPRTGVSSHAVVYSKRKRAAQERHPAGCDSKNRG